MDDLIFTYFLDLPARKADEKRALRISPGISFFVVTLVLFEGTLVEYGPQCCRVCTSELFPCSFRLDGPGDHIYGIEMVVHSGLVPNEGGNPS